MLFDNKYDNTIELASEISRLFRDNFSMVVNNLPQKAIQRINKIKEFETRAKRNISCDGNSIILETSTTEQNDYQIELTIRPLFYNSLYHYINVCNITKNKLKNLPINSLGKEPNTDPNITFNFINFANGTDHHTIEYNCYISKINKNEFAITIEHVYLDHLEETMELKNTVTCVYSYDTLLNKLNKHKQIR